MCVLTDLVPSRLTMAHPAFWMTPSVWADGLFYPLKQNPGQNTADDNAVIKANMNVLIIVAKDFHLN